MKAERDVTRQRLRKWFSLIPADFPTPSGTMSPVRKNQRQSDFSPAFRTFRLPHWESDLRNQPARRTTLPCVPLLLLLGFPAQPAFQRVVGEDSIDPGGAALRPVLRLVAHDQWPDQEHPL